MDTSHPLYTIWAPLLTYAALAPSPHNVQPWRVRCVSDTEAVLYIDPTRTLPGEDKTGAFLLSTMGMFVEAARIVALQYRWKLSSYLIQNPDKLAAAVRAPGKSLIPFSKLRLSPKESGDVSRLSSVPNSPSDLFLLARRRTSRLSFLHKPVTEEASRALRDLATENRQQFVQITNELAIERILRQNTKALFQDMNTPEYRDEITTWFRYTTQSAAATRDGLSAHCMNLPSPLFWAGANLPELFQISLLRPLFFQIYRSQLGNVPAIGVLSGKFFEPAESIDTGRFLLRFWIELARHNLYMHPFGNLVTNPDASAWFAKETGIADAYLIFKLGYSPEPPIAYRRTVEEIFTDESPISFSAECAG